MTKENKLAQQLKKEPKTEDRARQAAMPDNFGKPEPEPTPALTAIFKDPEKHTPEERAATAEADALEPKDGVFAYSASLDPEAFPLEPELVASPAPFPVGARLRYVGGRRLFAGWENIPVLDPGKHVSIVAVHGPFSFYEVEIPGGVYTFVIGDDDAEEWALVERA